MFERFKKEVSENKWILLLVMFIHAVTLTLYFDNKPKLIANNKTEKKKVIKIRLNPNQKPKIRKQIVTTEDSKQNLKDNKKKKFLSKKDQTVDRQTVAKSIGSFKKAGKGSKDGRNKPVTKQHSKVVKKKQVKKARKVVKKRSKNKKILLSDLMMDSKIFKEQALQKKVSAKGMKNGDSKKTGASQNNDYIEDIPLGDFTRLNTAEFKYYGFYFRIKQKLEQYWGNTLKKKAEALWRGGRRMPANVERITSLKIKLDSKGNIVNIFIKGTSGISELDDAAIESFNKAGPFPNPPSGMLQNGFAYIEWGFVVKS
jgi:protein TonB